MPQRLVDWSTLLKVEPDLPRRLDRAFFSVESLVRDLQAYQLDLREDVTELRADVTELREDVDNIDVELPDFGPGAGVYGGGGDFIETMEVDAKGRVVDLGVAPPPAAGSGAAVTAGSIFSMVGPTGDHAPVAPTTSRSTTHP